MELFTGIKDVDLKILSELNDRDLLTICSVKNKYIHNLCKDENLWRNKFITTYGKESMKHKDPLQTWKNFYLQIIIDLKDYSSKPWTFFNTFCWSFKGIDHSLFRSKLPFSKAPRWFLTNFYFLNLGNTINLLYDLDEDPSSELIHSKTFFTPETLLTQYFTYKESDYKFICGFIEYGDGVWRRQFTIEQL